MSFVLKCLGIRLEWYRSCKSRKRLRITLHSNRRLALISLTASVCVWSGVPGVWSVPGCELEKGT